MFIAERQLQEAHDAAEAEAKAFQFKLQREVDAQLAKRKLQEAVKTTSIVAKLEAELIQEKVRPIRCAGDA